MSAKCIGSSEFMEAVKGTLSGYDLTLVEITIDVDSTTGQIQVNICAMRE